MRPGQWPRTLEECPRLVMIWFPKRTERPEVERRIAREQFPHQWIRDNTMIAPEGVSVYFDGLTWGLELADPKLLRQSREKLAR